MGKVKGENIMSVPKSKRGESEMEFLQQARKLWGFTIQKCAQFPKKYTFYVGQPIAGCATRILECVKRANSIYATNEHETQMRLDELLQAKAELYALLSLIEGARELFGISGDAMKQWAALIDTEINLVQGLIKADRANAKKMKGE